MATQAKSRFAVEEIKPRIGSRIIAEKATLLSGQYAGDIRELMEQRGVLLFPEIAFTDEEQIAFTETLGQIATELKGGKVYQVTLDESVHETAKYLKATFFWHFDGFMSPMPIRASLAQAKVLSAPGTGRTEVCNTYAAYEALSDEDKQMLEGLTAVHALASTQLDVEPEPSWETWQAWREVGRKELPLVWTHASGRKSLVLGNSAYNVLELEPLEGKALLIRLRDWATRPEFVYSHEWKVGDMLLWDNTGTMHRALPYDPKSGRLLHRTKLEGEEPIR